MEIMGVKGLMTINVNFRVLEKSIWVLEKSWKFISEKGYEPCLHYYHNLLSVCLFLLLFTEMLPSTLIDIYEA